MTGKGVHLPQSSGEPVLVRQERCGRGRKFVVHAQVSCDSTHPVLKAGKKVEARVNVQQTLIAS